MRIKDGVDDGIERTPQYYEFMAQLQQFHDEIGTVLQPEPILGGKRLDLYRIYLGVKLAGGYERVSEEHGWQKIANPFDFPPTCTNSAYVIKKAYRNSIYNWVQVKEHGTPISALVIDPSTRRNFDDDGNAPAKRVRAQPQLPQQPAPVPTAFFAPQRGSGVVGAPIKVTEFAPDDKYLMGGPQNRLLLALQSNLPNEVDWAFSKLIKLSCSFPPNFHVGSIAGLIDAIIAHADPFFENLKLNTAVDNFETSPDSSRPESLQLLPHFSEITLFNLRDAHELLDRVLQVLHVLRNFSFTDIHIKFLIQQHKVLTLLAKSLALPTADCSLYAPVKHHSLDVFENLSVHIQLRGRHDFYLACLRKIVVESMDRALLLGALRSLTRLCGNDANHPHLSDMDPRVLERAWALVCLRPASTSTAAGTPAAGIDDAEIVYVALEFCYLFSCLGVDAVAMVVQAARPANIVGVLLGFLGWNRPDIRPRKRRAASQLLLPHLQQATPAAAASTPALVPGATANPSLATAPTVPSMTVPSQAGIPQAGKFATASGGKPAKRSSVKGEDEEVDIDGDEEELVEEGRVDLGVHGDRQVANFLQQSQMSQSADGFAVESVKKRRGRPPKRSDDPYAAAAQQQLLMQQQHQMMMMQQRNPGPPASQDSLFSQPLGSFSRNGAVAVAADDEFEEEDEPQADPLFECRWVAAASGSQQCTAKFGSEVEMLQHLAKEHFKAESAASAAEKFSCRWAGCTAFHSFPASRADVFCHSRTHIGDSSKKLKTFSQSAVKKPFRTGGVDGVDPIGSPLTALLILKNIARSQRMRDLFLPFEADLALAMTERPKFSKIVAELMWELR